MPRRRSPRRFPLLASVDIKHLDPLDSANALGHPIRHFHEPDPGGLLQLSDRLVWHFCRQRLGLGQLRQEYLWRHVASGDAFYVHAVGSRVGD